MNKKLKRKIIKVILDIVVVLILLVFIAPKNSIKETVIFSACVDGDTAKFIVNGKVETVRFLAVDTPESVHPTKEVQYYGKEASDFTCNEIKNASKIMLEFDENSDRYDKYDRLLAWIFVDDNLLQSKLVGVGYAKVAYLYDDYKYTNILLEYQAIASQKGLGIWYNK